MRLDAVGVYERLEEIVVYHLGHHENRHKHSYEHREADRRPERSRAHILHRKCQHHSDYAAYHRTDIWYHIEYAGDEGYAYGVLEAQSRDDEHAQEVHQGYTQHLAEESGEIARDEDPDFVQGFDYLFLISVRHEGCYQVDEQAGAPDEEEGYEYHREQSHSYGTDSRCH